MLVTLFTNVKVDCIFVKMNCAKSEKRNKLKRARVDVWLRVGEEGPPMEMEKSNPDPFIDF